MEDNLKETYGITVYQEQVMSIAHKMADFSLAQADILRKALGGKTPEEMEKMKKTNDFPSFMKKKDSILFKNRVSL